MELNTYPPWHTEHPFLQLNQERQETISISKGGPLPKNVILSNQRDIPLLHFLWKWRLVTVAALTQKFFPMCSEKTAYNRLLALEHAKRITIRSKGNDGQFLCALDRQGYEAIKEELPLLSEPGFKPEHIEHDFLVSAFHLGDWLKDKPENTSLFSAQQLRRIDSEMYPSWVPRSPTHIPDGYTLVKKGDRDSIFAIEVELYSRTELNYQLIGDLYRYLRNVEKVFWLVSGDSLARKIEIQLIKAMRDRPSNHNFILLKEFVAQGWDAPIVIGPDEGRSLSTLFSEIVPKSGENPSDSNLARFLLDTRKSPHKSRNCRIYSYYAFAD